LLAAAPFGLATILLLLAAAPFGLATTLLLIAAAPSSLLAATPSLLLAPPEKRRSRLTTTFTWHLYSSLELGATSV
jgi:hypothetical protein